MNSARRRTGEFRLFLPALVGWGTVSTLLPHPGIARVVSVLCAVLCVLLLTLLCVPALRARFVTVLRVASVVCAVVLVLTASLARGEAIREHTSLSTGFSHEDVHVTLTGYPTQQESFASTSSWVNATVHDGVHIRLWFSEEAPRHWSPGTELRVSGAASPLEPASTAAFGFSVDSWTEQQAAHQTFATVAASLRETLREASANHSRASLLPGLAVGDTALVSDDLDDAMKVSSLTHLTAVSGANCALIVSAAMWCAARVGAPRRLRLILAVVCLAGFVVIVGPDPSVQRATVMALVMLSSSFGSKPHQGLPSLGFAIILLIALDPWQALHPGFALSVAATAGILLLTKPIHHWLRTRARLPSILGMPVAVAVAAQFACGPLLILLDPSLPAAGVLANVIAAPAAPLGTGIGLIAAFTLPLSSTLGEFVIAAGSQAAYWIEITAVVTSELPYARLPWLPGWLGTTVLAAVQTLVIIAILQFSGRHRFSSKSRVQPRQPWQTALGYRQRLPMPTVLSAAVCAAASIGITVSIVAVVPAVTAASTPTDWSVVACDVGQGDALLIRDPQDHESVMLIDTGDSPEALEECLDTFRVQRIALLVLTHDDADHVGALEVVLDRADAALIAPTVVGDAERTVPVELRAANIPTYTGEAGLTGTVQSGELSSDAGIHWRVLSPPASRVHTDRNAASLVLLVEVDGLRALFLADTGETEQRALLNDPHLHRIDIVKVAHHGSSDQSSRLYERLKAPVGLVSAGVENSYGHPTRATLSMLQQASTLAARTDLHGSIAVRNSEGRLALWSQR